MSTDYTFTHTEHFIVDSAKVGDNISAVGDNPDHLTLQPLIGYDPYDLVRTDQAPHLQQVGIEDTDNLHHAALCLMMGGDYEWETVEEALSATRNLIARGEVYFDSHAELYVTDTRLSRLHWNAAAQQFCEDMNDDILICLLESTVGDTYEPNAAVDQLFSFTDHGAQGLVWNSATRQLLGFEDDGTIVWIRQAQEVA